MRSLCFVCLTVRRGPFAKATPEERIEYLLTRVRKTDLNVTFADHALEHTLSSPVIVIRSIRPCDARNVRDAQTTILLCPALSGASHIIASGIQSWNMHVETHSTGLKTMHRFQRRVRAIKQEFLKRAAKTPLGITQEYWDRTEAQQRGALHSHILVYVVIEIVVAVILL